MQKTILTTLFLSIGLLIFGQQKEYFNLEGKIGDHPISMILVQSKYLSEEGKEPTYIGSYYYESQQIPITIQQMEKKKDKLIMVYQSDDKNREIFDGRLDNGTFKGSWTKGKQKLNFELNEKSKDKFTEILHLNKKRTAQISLLNSDSEVEGKYEMDFFLPLERKLQKSLMMKISNKEYVNFSDYSNQILDEFENSYREEIKDYFTGEDTTDLSSTSWNHTYQIFLEPYMETADYLIMSYSGYQYTGGAHGISYQYFYTYDKKKEKWLQLDDVFNLNHKAQIETVIDNEIKKQYNIPLNQKLNEGEDTNFLAEKAFLPENFTLSKKGITFHYGLYDLMPYVYGYFDIFVPYENLEPHLQKGFKY